MVTYDYSTGSDYVTLSYFKKDWYEVCDVCDMCCAMGVR